MKKMGQGSKLLKVTSILMIVFGSIALLLGIFATIGALAILGGAVAIGTDGAELVGELVMAAAVAALLGAVIQFVAGIIGVKNYNKPEKATICIVFGILVALIAVVSLAFDLAGGQFGLPQVFSILLSMAIPVLYLVGALQLKKMA